MELFLATTNGGKIERFTKLIRYIDPAIAMYSPDGLGVRIEDIMEDGTTLSENARIKAKSYFGKVDMPILANDTGFYVEGEGFIVAPKRHALRGLDEKELSKEVVSNSVLNFWKEVATRHGGNVDAAWIEAFVVLYQDGTVRESESRREVLLTNRELGVPTSEMPLRALYYSKATGKPSILHSAEEERIEMKPLIDALSEVIVR